MFYKVHGTVRRLHQGWDQGVLAGLQDSVAFNVHNEDRKDEYSSSTCPENPARMPVCFTRPNLRLGPFDQDTGWAWMPDFAFITLDL